jgi:aminoglycoside/choline kinase family phosphotransferase
MIVMDAPPSLEPCNKFLNIAQVFSKARVPQIIHHDLAQGFLLLEDFGTTTFLERITQEPESFLTSYQKAIEALISIQELSQEDRLEQYSEDLLTQEMNLFPEWFVHRHLGEPWNDEQKNAWKASQEILLNNIKSQPQVYVHRDFHSRNLMVLDQENTLGILDFQDAVYGPVSYDLVSLLKDAYISWPEEKVLEAVIRYWTAARERGLPVSESIDDFYRDFEWMGIQRHLKVVGIFSRLHYRDNKSGYLKDIPKVLSYLNQAIQRYRDLNDLYRLLSPYLTTPKDMRKIIYSF